MTGKPQEATPTIHPRKTLTKPRSTCTWKEKVRRSKGSILTIAFIITGGAGSIGGACARRIIAKGGIALIFDVVPDEIGQAKAKEYHPERALYFKVDITDLEGFETACIASLEVIPKGALAGGVHCAAIAPGRPWDKKVTNSAAVNGPQGWISFVLADDRLSKKSCTSTLMVLLWLTLQSQIPSILNTQMRDRLDPESTLQRTEVVSSTLLPSSPDLSLLDV